MILRHDNTKPITKALALTAILAVINTFQEQVDRTNLSHKVQGTTVGDIFLCYVIRNTARAAVYTTLDSMNSTAIYTKEPSPEFEGALKLTNLNGYSLLSDILQSYKLDSNNPTNGMWLNYAIDRTGILYTDSISEHVTVLNNLRAQLLADIYTTIATSTAVQLKYLAKTIEADNKARYAEVIARITKENENFCDL